MEVYSEKLNEGIQHSVTAFASGAFSVVPPSVSGLFAKGDVKDMALVHLGPKHLGRKALLVVRNNESLLFIRVLNKE